MDEGFAGLAARRVAATERGSLLHEISERFWTDARKPFRVGRTLPRNVALAIGHRTA